MTIGELLLTPFQPIKVLRELGPYGRILDLEPSVPKAPDPEFLVRLLSDHASHQAYIRHRVGSQYKNLENLVRGKHKVSSTTKLLLANTLGLSIDDLEKLDGTSPDGPLIPAILALFQIVESLSMRVTAGMFDREVACHCCGMNLLNDVDIWWQKHVPEMGAAEYRFAERLLNAIVGASLIECFVVLLQERSDLSLDRLSALANPSHHPIGNWLLEAQVTMSCSSLAELAIAMQLRGNVGTTFSHGRLKKWSAGHHLMPLAAGEAIAQACGPAKSWIRRLIAARTIALVTDFVAASMPNKTKDAGQKIAREAVCARLEQLGSNLQIAIASIRGANSSASCFLGT